jgi:hypothetical protein
MILQFFNGYPDFIGYRQAFAGSGTGPASYVTGGDPVTLQNPRRFIDVFFGGALTLSGTYYVLPIPAAAEERTTWKAVWRVTSTNAEVGAAVDLSGETVVLGGFCGQF